MLIKMKRFLKMKKTYRNILEALTYVLFLRKILGASFFSIQSTSSNNISVKLSYLGFLFFFFWHSLYFWSMYNVFLGDQTLLRLLYETKICQYGDLVENTAITFYVLYTMWKISFDLSGSTQHVQQIMEIDVALERLGETVDYSRSAVMTLLIPIFQIGVCSVRILIVWISTSGRIESIPYSKLFQIVFSDSLSFTVMNHFCIYLYALYHRYRRLNTVLIKLQSSTFRDCFVRSKKCLSLAPRTQDRDACARINSCGKLYSMLFKATETVNDKFGLALLLTMFVWLVLIVLYLYYFMEATAGGLFHDVQRYINLLMYISWQVIFSVGIISSAIYCCEKIVKEAKFTSYVVHTIINYNSDVYAVKEAALNLSMQIVHQAPKFTARGLFPVEYVLLLEGARSVLTFLVILLQFVTEKT